MLHDGKGNSQEVKIGLVDKSGAFLLLMGSNEVAHFKFSDQEGCIVALSKELDGERKANEKLQKQVDKLAAALDRRDRALTRAEARVAKLEMDLHRTAEPA